MWYKDTAAKGYDGFVHYFNNLFGFSIARVTKAFSGVASFLSNMVFKDHGLNVIS